MSNYEPSVNEMYFEPRSATSKRQADSYLLKVIKPLSKLCMCQPLRFGWLARTRGRSQGWCRHPDFFLRTLEEKVHFSQDFSFEKYGYLFSKALPASCDLWTTRRVRSARFVGKCIAAFFGIYTCKHGLYDILFAYE